MMILSAVILVLAFIALAGMVARVSQLASQTTSENDRVILSDVGPMASALDQSICRLKASTTTTKLGTADLTPGATSLTDIKNGITLAAADVGMTVTGTGIPAGTRITSISGTTATISQAVTVTVFTGDVSISLAPCLASGTATVFSYSATTTPKVEDAVRDVLGHMEAIEAQHGFWMDSSLECWTGVAGMGRAVVAVSDGTVWVEFRSTVPFAMSGC